jgi:hypothetical protein
MWMDLLLLLVVLVPMVSWSEIRLRPSHGSLSAARQLPSTLEVSELQAVPAGQPHPTLAP